MSLKPQDKYSIEVSQQVLDKIKMHSCRHQYTTKANLYYEDQVPIVAYLLEEGTITLVKKRRKNVVIEPKRIIGLYELIENTPSLYGAEINSGSYVYFIYRSTVLELLEDQTDSALKDFLQDIVRVSA